ncbi:ABC transporter [Mycena rebaudengoi]|nr:ABC transporter [Mycena rebaudengoi]
MTQLLPNRLADLTLSLYDTFHDGEAFSSRVTAIGPQLVGFSLSYLRTPSNPPTMLADLEEDSVEATATQPEHQYVEGVRLFLVFIAFLLASSLMALDQTIIATALPSIASDFRAISRLSWIASGYFLPQAGVMLLFGKILSIAPGKSVFLVAIAIFVFGSLLCALATSVDFLIVGRVIAGVGAAGIWVAVLTIIGNITKLESRPLLLGSFGAVFAISSIVGPLLGGVFAQKLTWRWCFWINLPLGAVTILAVLFTLPNYKSSRKSSWRGWLELDWTGSILSVATVVLFLLPLQMGGNERPWRDPVVISLFCVSGALLGLFFFCEYRQRDNAILPLALLLRPTQAGACLTSFFLYICFVLGTYYLPFFYQAKGHSPTKSGIDILPYMLSGVLSAAGAGAIVNFTHRFWPFLFFPPLLAAVAAGLMTTVRSSTPPAVVIGFQILFGCGVGAAMQSPILAVQADFVDEPERIPQATSLVSFSQLLGLAVGVAAGGAVFGNELEKQLTVQAPFLSGDLRTILKGSVKLISALPPDEQTAVVRAYTQSLSAVYYIAIPCAVLASMAALLVKNQVLTNVQ